MYNIQRFIGIGFMILFVFSALQVRAQWPKYIPLKNGGKITLYQPQSEKLEGDKITGRAAVSIKKSAKGEPVFGAIFFVATIATDKDSRTATLQSLYIKNAKFPGVIDTAKLNTFAKLVETEVPKWNLEISLDAVITSIKQENAAVTNDKFKNDPPEIIFRTKPTALIILDGDPKIQKDKNLDADRVVNTPALIFKEGDQWNLYSGGLWYKSSSVLEGWKRDKSLSDKVKKIDEQIKKKEKENSDGKTTTTPPEQTDIIVSKVPAELLQTKGEPEYKSVQGTSLLYMSNTTSDVFKEIIKQEFFVLLSGRWYKAPTFSDKWTYVAADKLPVEFTKIPPGSEKDNVLASVPGTQAAEDAKMDAQIPQTAKVDRKTAKVKVEYDGTPKFKAIEETSLELAENSNIRVLKDTSGKFYAVDNGIWFVSSAATGPWAVADDRPKDVDKIPASNPSYNTKYVYVYESTPEYVYVGYTPGYMGCYVYGPTIVYGTGYYYAPWYGSVYYPYPVTWGYGFAYNPYMGWGVGIGIGISIGFWAGYGGWWGPPMYRPPYYGYGGYYGHGGYYGNGGYHGNGGYNGENRPGNGGNRPGGDRNQVEHHNGNRGNNIYNNQPGVSTRESNRGNTAGLNRPSTGTNDRPGTAATRPSARPAGGADNVFSDMNGNTFQRDNKGNWSQRNNQSNQWSPMNQNSSKTREMNQNYQNRDWGNTRQQNFQQSRSGGGYGGGGMRGGGGGGRRR